MERFLVAILFVSAVVGASSASSRVLLVDGAAPTSPTLSPPPKSDLAESGKGSPPIHASDSSNSSINPENKDGKNQTVTLAPPSGPGSKDPRGANLAPPSGPERTEQQGGPESLAPPVGPGNKDPTLVPPAKPETQKPLPPPLPSAGDDGKNNKDTKQTEITDKIQEETCDAAVEKCRIDDEKFVACLKHYGNALNKLYLLVQNTGKNTIPVDIKPPPFVTLVINNTVVKHIELSKQVSKQVNISVLSSSSSGEIVLKAGKGECSLHVNPSISNGIPFEWLASYATLLTPVYGAYLLILSVIIAGGVWACCKFSRGRRADTGVPYRQLEMGGIPQTDTTVMENANSVDGWENSWDDDWDEEEAVVKASEKAPAGSASTNGLSSRSRNNSNKDGWDVDWDD
ncbi:hypothetical protein ACMD2_20700 [Ananas comosus]|uniref:DUF7356 domain-containing protein n=1 Tax=Ananas comosus TaxID=4615 RepID=A0A199VXL3_ANACO|nr:hypothetical protein ACMD2_20700 [Ananas comosus]